MVVVVGDTTQILYICFSPFLFEKKKVKTEKENQVVSRHKKRQQLHQREEEEKKDDDSFAAATFYKLLLLTSLVALKVSKLCLFTFVYFFPCVYISMSFKS